MLEEMREEMIADPWQLPVCVLKQVPRPSLSYRRVRNLTRMEWMGAVFLRKRTRGRQIMPNKKSPLDADFGKNLSDYAE